MIIIISIKINYVYCINNYFLSNMVVLTLFLVCIYIVVGFMLVFPQMAVGIKPDLSRVWWMLKGNSLRLIQTIMAMTVPALILSIIPILLIYQLGQDPLFLNAVQAVIGSAFSLLIMGLWAGTLSICYFHLTGRQPLAGGAPAVSEDPETA